MTAIDIANPGENEAALKAALADLTGWARISSGRITEPVEYFDVALPSGFDQYCIRLLGVLPNDYLSAAFSSDDGDTFHNDADNFDTYLSLKSGAYGDGDIFETSGISSVVDSLIYLTRVTSAVTKIPVSGDVWIRPGVGGTTFPDVACSLIAGLDHDPLAISYSNNVATFCNEASSPPVLARQNLIRILPYGNGDCDPPTSNVTIDAGSWTLFGVPAAA